MESLDHSVFGDLNLNVVIVSAANKLRCKFGVPPLILAG